jgi:hypothetical protein
MRSFVIKAEVAAQLDAWVATAPEWNDVTYTRGEVRSHLRRVRADKTVKVNQDILESALYCGVHWGEGAADLALAVLPRSLRFDPYFSLIHEARVANV